jgi:8-oxo-dGTP diphosphatase
VTEGGYCPRCAAPLHRRPPTACTGCGYAQFVNARPTGLVIVVDGDRFLAIRRAREPRRGGWALPGGFCDGWEHPADAARREAAEELGATVTLGTFVGMYVGPYEFQGERFPVLDCFFLASLDRPELAPDPREVSDVHWFDLDNPPDLAFPTMASAIADTQQLISR